MVSTEVSVLNQKEVGPLKMTHDATRNLVKDVIPPRVISNMVRLEALEESSLNPRIDFGSISGVVSLNEISRLDDRMKALEHEVTRSRQADGEAYAFINLGFRSKKESDTW